MMTNDFHDIAESLANTCTLEETTLPLLSALETITGLECTYLTRIDRHQSRLKVLFTHHSSEHGIVVPQGTTVQWDETFCKHSLDDKVRYTTAADRLWPQLTGPSVPGILTFMSQPILDARGTMVGTLCAASSRRVSMAEDALPVMRLFAQLIGLHIERDQTLANAQTDCKIRSDRVIDEALEDGADHQNLKSEMSRVLGLAV